MHEHTPQRGTEAHAAHETPGKRPQGPITKARTAVKIVVFAVIFISLGFHTGWGTYSSLGLDFVASVCPLGALEGLFGAWSFVPRLVIALAVSILVILVFGKAFCAWICPVPPLSSFFRTKKTAQREQKSNDMAGQYAWKRFEKKRAGIADTQSCANRDAGTVDICNAADACNSASSAGPSSPSGHDAHAAEAAPCAQPSRNTAKLRLDSRHAVLCGALGSAAIFGFPVFCLVCPIGLTCATLVLLMRLVGVGELSWGLLVFPVAVVLELTLLRKYCAKICPISALMSLVASLNKTFRPSVDESACLRADGHTACHACSSACPEHIDPRSNEGIMPETECTRCGKCLEACPASAISFPLLRKESHPNNH